MRSFRLSKRSDAGTWLADLTLDDGSQRTIDTKQNAKGPAEKRARWILRHTIARRRHAARVALQAKGKPIPPDLAPKRPGRRKPAAAVAPPAEKRKPGRPRKAPAAAAAPARPTLDHEAIAARLRSLTAPAPPAEEEGPPSPAAAPPVPDQGELGEDDPTPVQRPPIAADDAPPMPEAAPEPLTPEVMPPASSEDGDLFAGLIATFLVAGLIKGNKTIAAAGDPPLELGEPHAGSVTWMQQGIENKVRKIFGDRVIGDGTKIFLGAIGITLSMFLGAEVKTAAPASGEASANTESERERSAATDAGDFAAPSDAMVHQNGTPTPGPKAAAAGKFR